MICKHCRRIDNSDVTVDDLQGVECSNSCSNSSPCNVCVELANLEDAIARLKMKRCELQLERNINRSHSPFIRRIPPEIIATISGFANTDFTITGSLPVPILLSSICSDWRRTVVGTPQLWSLIKIDLPPLRGMTSDMISSTLLRLATFIDKWLIRSGQLPLYISLCWRCQWNPHVSFDSRKVPPNFQDFEPIFVPLANPWHFYSSNSPPISSARLSSAAETSPYHFQEYAA